MIGNKNTAKPGGAEFCSDVHTKCRRQDGVHTSESPRKQKQTKNQCKFAVKSRIHSQSKSQVLEEHNARLKRRCQGYKQ